VPVRNVAIWSGAAPPLQAQGAILNQSLMVLCITTRLHILKHKEHAERQEQAGQVEWLLKRKPAKFATVALANKTARIARAVMSCKEV